MLHYRHFILCERACLIGAYDLSAAQRLYGSKPAYDGVALAHICNAYGQHNGNDCGKALRDSCDSKGYRHHEVIKYGLGSELSRHYEIEYEYEQAYAQHHLG